MMSMNTPELRREVLPPRPALRSSYDLAADLASETQRADVRRAIWFTAWLVALLAVLSSLLGASS